MASFGGGRWPIINMRNLGVVDKMKIVHWPQNKQQGFEELDIAELLLKSIAE